MPRVVPSRRVREEIDRVLRHGNDGQARCHTYAAAAGAQRLVQEVLEEELTDFLGRERYVRHRGYRNVNESGRVRTAELG